MSGCCGCWWVCWLRCWHWRPRTCFKVRRIFRSTYTSLTVFTPAALNQKVALGGEMGEPRTLLVLSAKLLTLLRGVRVSVVVNNVVFREVAGPLNKVPTYGSLIKWRRKIWGEGGGASSLLPSLSQTPH